MGGLQVVGVGAVAVELQASKHAEHRYRLNERDFVYRKQ